MGTFDLIDDDKICLTNLNRQILATRKTVGKYKVEVAKERILEINPKAVVNTYQTFYLPGNADQFDFTQYDYIVDAIDTVSGKIQLVCEANRVGTPIISSMGTGNRLDPSKFRITDLSKTSGCPLAKVMRRELRARGIKHHTVLASEELPLTPRKLPGQESERRTPPGSVSWVPPCAGMMIAGYIVQQLLAQKSPEHAPV